MQRIEHCNSKFVEQQLGSKEQLLLQLSPLQPQQLLLLPRQPAAASSSTSLVASASSSSVSFEPSSDAPAELGAIPSFAKEKKTRRTSQQAQIERNNKKIQDNMTNAAHKRATKWYAGEKKKTNGLSAAAVCEKVNKEFQGKTNISSRSVTRYVKDDKAGESPKKRGYQGVLSKDNFKRLCDAFETYLQIQQINSKDHNHTRKHLAALINQVVGIPENGTGRIKENMFDRLMQSTNVNFLSDVSAPVEELRHRWTNYSNLSRWFDGWEEALVDLGFATRDGSGNAENFTSELRHLPTYIVTFDPRGVRPSSFVRKLLCSEANGTILVSMDSRI